MDSATTGDTALEGAATRRGGNGTAHGKRKMTAVSTISDFGIIQACSANGSVDKGVDKANDRDTVLFNQPDEAAATPQHKVSSVIITADIKIFWQSLAHRDDSMVKQEWQPIPHVGLGKTAPGRAPGRAPACPRPIPAQDVLLRQLIRKNYSERKSNLIAQRSKTVRFADMHPSPARRVTGNTWQTTPITVLPRTGNKIRALTRLAIYVSIFCTNLFFAQAVTGQSLVAKKIVVDEFGIAFAKDLDGVIWAFRRPLSFKDPIKMLIPHKIREITPYLAVDSIGRLYQWELDPNKSVRIPDNSTGFDYDLIAHYSTPFQIADVKGVSLIASNGRQFSAVVERRTVLSWTGNVDPSGSVTAGYGRPEKIFVTPEDILSLTVTHSNVVALLENGEIWGWRSSKSGLASNKDQQAGEIWRTAAIARDGSKIYVNQFHLIVLTKNGKIRSWGGCKVNSYLPNISPTPKNVISNLELEAKYNLEEVTSIAVSRNDNSIFNIVLKNDGSVWSTLAPTISGEQSGTSCRRTGHPQTISTIAKGMNVKAIDVASTGSSGPAFFLVLGADNSLWRGDLRDPIRTALQKISPNR